jgi:membrane protein implicated in regulation of membrane protease activity
MAARSIAAALAAAGDLTGNWSWTVWLLIPVVLLLAYVTARCVGPDGAPPRSRASTHGVTEYLDRDVSEEEAR